MIFFSRKKRENISVVYHNKESLTLEEITELTNLFLQSVRRVGLKPGDILVNRYFEGNSEIDSYTDYERKIGEAGKLSFSYNSYKPDFEYDKRTFCIVTFALELPKRNDDTIEKLNQVFCILETLLDKFKMDTKPDITLLDGDWFKFRNSVPKDFSDSAGRYVWGDEW